MWPFGNRKPKGTACLAFCPQGVALAWVVVEAERGVMVRAVARGSRQEVASYVRDLKLRQVPFVGLFHPAMYPLLPVEAPQEVPRAEWGAVMRWKLADRFGFPAEEAVVDLFESPRDGQPSILYVAAARQPEVVACARFFQDHALRLESIGIWELALAGMMTQMGGNQGIHGLLYLDESVTLFLLVEAGTVHLVRRLVVGKPVDRLAGEVVREVEHGLDWFASHGGNRGVNGLFLLSPLWETEALQQQLKQRLGLPVTDCRKAWDFSLEEGVEENDTLAYCLPAIGAAWRRESCQ